MKNIIACIDGSVYSQHVTNVAVWTAKKLLAPLTLLHVLEKSSVVESELSGTIGLGSQEQLLQELVELDEKRAKLALQHGTAVLRDLKASATHAGVNHVAMLQKHGNLIETLIDIEPEIRVLVMGRLGHIHKNDTKAIGSQLESVVRMVNAHILLATAEFTPPCDYLLAFDGSEISHKLVEKAIQTPLLEGMTCHLVMVTDGNENTDAFLSASLRLKNNGITVIEAQLEGEVHRSILDYQESQNLGMIVMGAYGHSKLRQFFVGSNTTKIIVNSDVPLLLIS